MALKTFNPTTPGQRGLVLVDRAGLWKGKPVKKLTEGLTKNGGRNNTGRITARRRGGGHKRAYRLIDFKRNRFDMVATVERIEYDPNRSAFIALVNYEDGEQTYILAPQRLAPQLMHFPTPDQVCPKGPKSTIVVMPITPLLVEVTHLTGSSIWNRSNPLILRSVV